jgi:endonuclease-3
LAERNPNPRCELHYTSAFQLLLSVMLSAQTTDKAVNAAMTGVYDEGFGAADVLELGESGFLKLIRRIGLAPTKAKRAVKLARIIEEEHGGKVPRTREALEALPGVGRKTASVVLAELEQAKTLAVDTHVFRVTRRLGLHDEKTAEACEAALMKVVDPKWLPAAHHWFILHGRYTCKAVKPDCDHCPLNDICPSVT